MPQTNIGVNVNEWELSKENIQPIKQGRKAEILSNALNDSLQKKLNIEKHEFENELRSYSGNDPLDIWYRYTLWVEQHYPKGGKDGNLFKLIESCFVALTSSGETESKYKNDERYLDLWIKYATLCPRSLEVYNGLNSKNIFTELSTFFENWAYTMEESGNLKKANAIYLEGIQRKARPINALEMAYTKFQARVAQKTLEDLSSNVNENSETDIQRKAFSALKPKGTKAKTPIERVSTVIGSAGRLSNNAPKVNAAGPTFKIFQDENACSNVAIPTEAALPSGSSFTSYASSTTENQKNPSVWNKNKLKQKTTVTVPIENVDRLQKPAFNVHADEGVEAKSTQPQPSEFAGILSTKKSEHDWHVPLFVSDPFNPNAVPQYCKQLVYVGNEEFSFEELRALARKREDEKNKEDELQDELKKLRFMLKQKEDLLKDKEDIISTLMHDKNNVEIRENEPKVKVPPTTSNKRLYEDSWVAINKTASFVANATQNVSHDFNESSTKSLLSLQPVSNRKKEMLDLPPLKTDISSPSSSNNSSAREISRSPTVNTKFAKNLVTSLFSRSLFSNSVSGVELKPPTDNSQSTGGLEHVFNEVPTKISTHEDKISDSINDTNFNASGANYPIQNGPLKLLTYDEKADKKASPLTTLSIYQDENEIAPFPIHNDEIEKSAQFPIYSDEIGKPAPFLIYSDENEEPLKPLNSFPIYCDENETEENFQIYSDNGNECQNNPPFKIFSDENPSNQSTQKLTSKTTWSSNSPSKYIYEDQENCPPVGYQIVKPKRTITGILKPSKDIPFIPLEEQEKDLDREEEIEGIAPLSAGYEQADYTLKMPKPEEFSKFIGVASTPMPWSSCVVPQANINGDDFTMALPIKTQRVGSLDNEAELSVTKETLTSSSENLVSSDQPSIDKSKENSAELMPPPMKEVPNQTPQTFQDTGFEANTIYSMKNYLSPIMEASREYKSSTSSSSGSCTTFGTHSNLHGITNTLQFPTGNASKSFNISQSKCLSGYGGDGEYCGMVTQETSKSGYLADKSKGESINDFSSKKPVIPENRKNLSEDFNNSFNLEKFANKLNISNDLEDDKNVYRDIGDGKTDSVMKKSLQNRKNLSEDFNNSFDPEKIANMLNISNDLEDDNGYCDIGDGKTDSVMKKSLQLFSPLEKSVQYPKEIDPFCNVLQGRLMMSLKYPIMERAGFVGLNEKCPQIKPRSKVTLGKEMYKIKQLKGSGAYAHIFHASTIDPMNVTAVTPSLDEDDDDEDDELQMVLKVQKPACMWEFYICHELRERLKKQNTSENILNSVMRINRGYFFTQGSILVTQYHKLGTLLDGVNGVKKLGRNMPEKLIYYIMSKLIETVIALHSCHIIHGDLKPDNVLLVQNNNLGSVQRTSCRSINIKLIDFGRSIDMDLFPSGTTFMRKVSTDGFTICEMRDNRPWTYQTDYYGLAAIAHVMLWGSYMNIKKEGSMWKLNGVNYYRYMNTNLWQKFFHKMLNISSCTEFPDLEEILKEFNQLFALDNSLNQEIRMFCSSLA